MALITPGRSSNRPGYFRKAFIKYIRNGQIIVTKWPDKRGTPKLIWQRAAVDRMKIGMKLLKTVSDREQNTLREGLKNYLSKHGGLKASSAIRLRDWLFANITGRSWTITTPEGKKIYSAAVVRDMSDFLDTMEPRVGSMMVRGQKAWNTTVQPKPGGVFQTSLSGTVPQCAKEASVPHWREAVGGYPPDATMEEWEKPDPLPPQPVTTRYIRVFVEHTHDGFFIGIAEVQLRAVEGGTDITGDGTAMASSTFSDSTPASNAFDNDLQTIWRAQAFQETDEWVGYDFGEPVELSQVTLQARLPANQNQLDAMPRVFRIDISPDGNNWETVERFDEETAWSEGELREYNIAIQPGGG